MCRFMDIGDKSTKYEVRNSKQVISTKKQNLNAFSIYYFVFGICLGFRI